MEIIVEPAIVFRPALFTLAISARTPFRGMLAERDRLWSELADWLDRQGIPYAGSLYLRLKTVDMAGEMDIEAGLVVSEPREGNGRIRAGELPAGSYVTLTHRQHSVRANRLLLDWAARNGIVLDREEGSAGDRFGCRYERILSDTAKEPRKTTWLTQLNIRTADTRPSPDAQQG